MVWLLVLVVLGACEARTLRVPAEYATIQAALGSVSNGDTVLVSLGTYPEALRAPGRAFVLMGDVPADTADIPRPVIDPSPLPHSDTLTCLIVPFGASVEVRNMRLRNGAEMFPRATPYPGGIRCLAATLRAEYCVFDSTAGGIATSRDSSARVELNGCRFVRNSRACVVMPGDPTVRPLRAALCRFEATGVENVVSAGGGSSLSYCDFQVEAASDMLSLAGRDCVVDHCTFRVSESVTNVIKLLGGPDGGCSGSIAYNTFDGINMWTAGIFAESACVDPVDIRYNVFRNNTRSTLTFAGQVYVRCHNNSPGTAAGIIEGNSFDACPGARCLLSGRRRAGCWSDRTSM